MPVEISPIVLDQRIRNRIIEYLETASSYEAQLQYEKDVPIADVPAEMICRWEDWVNDLTRAKLLGPVYSDDEQTAISRFQDIWVYVADNTPKFLPPLTELIESPIWEKLRLGAEQALEVFLRRGKFDEEKKQF